MEGESFVRHFVDNDLWFVPLVLGIYMIVVGMLVQASAWAWRALRGDRRQPVPNQTVMVSAVVLFGALTVVYWLSSYSRSDPLGSGNPRWNAAAGLTHESYQLLTKVAVAAVVVLVLILTVARERSSGPAGVGAVSWRDAVGSTPVVVTLLFAAACYPVVEFMLKAVADTTFVPGMFEYVGR